MELISKYKKAHNRLILLDYDGTLVNFTLTPDEAKPSVDLLNILYKLSCTPCTKVIIITGREYKSIDKLIGHLPIDIIAEHGAMIKENGTWKEQINNVTFWKKEVLLSLNEITSKCPGSFIEEKSFSLAWHYRNSETEAGHTYSRELIRLLDNNIHFSVLKILDGNKVVELLHNGIGKGRSVNNLIAQNTYDCILSIGDDVTDEDMFEVLKDNENSFTIKVGSGNTSAKYRLDAPKNVLQLLELL